MRRALVCSNCYVARLLTAAIGFAVIVLFLIVHDDWSGGRSYAAESTKAAATPPGLAAAISRGGRLYDNHWAVIGKRPPANRNPLYPTGDAADDLHSWRCVACHGWDLPWRSRPPEEKGSGLRLDKSCCGTRSRGHSGYSDEFKSTQSNSWQSAGRRRCGPGAFHLLRSARYCSDRRRKWHGQGRSAARA